MRVIAGKLKQKIGLVILGLLLVFTPVASVALLPTPVYAGDEKAAACGTLEVACNLASFGKSLINMFLLTITRVLMEIMAVLGYLFSVVISFLQWALNPTFPAPGGSAEAAKISIWQMPEVAVGWRIVRDIINGFFIVVLIAIAISTIIRFQPYNFRSTLPRLLLATLLVNFSRTICLLGINFADAVMSTFATQLISILPAFAIGLRVPALTALGSASLGDLYGPLEDFTSNQNKSPVEMLTIMVSVIMGLMLMAGALGGIVMFALLLIFRIVVLWFLMILSPLAFFLWGAPGRAASYWGQWLEEYVKHVIVGPIGAFFLYIIVLFFVNNLQSSYGYKATQTIPVAGNTVALDPKILFGYFVTLGMMFIALEMIEQLGVRGASLARQIGVEGIAKGGYARKIASDYLAPVYGVAADTLTKATGIPRGLLRPGIALEGIKGGLSKKRQQLEHDAIASQGKALAYWQKKPGFIGSAFALATGDQDAVANALSWKDIKARSGAIGVGGMATWSGMNANVANASRYLADKNAMNGFTNLTDGQQGQVSTLTGSKLQSLADNKDELLKLHNELGDLSLLASEATRTGDAGLLQQAQAEAAALMPRYDELRQGTDVDELMKDDANLDKLKDYAELLQRDGVTIGKQNTIGSDIGAIQADKAGFEKRGQAAIAEVKRRQKNVQVAKSGARADLVDKIHEASAEMYQKDVKYDLEDITGDLLGNQNKESKSKYAAALLKGAEQGYGDDLRLRINPEFEGTTEGIAKFAEHLKTEMGFGEDDAMTIIAEMQGRAGGANKLADTGWVKLDAISKDYKLTTKAEQEKIVQKRTANQPLEDILRKFKRDGLGNKNSAGKYIMNAGIAAAMRKENFDVITKNTTTLGRMDNNTKQFLLDNASSIGLTPEQQADIKGSLK